MLGSVSYQKDTLVLTYKVNQRDSLLCKGQIIMYEGEEAEVIRVKPLIVIKTENRVVCGDLRKQLGGKSV